MRALAVSFLLFALCSPLVVGEGDDAIRAKAESGDSISQTNLGVMYHNGEGVSQDDKQAVYWWTLAAKQGDASSQYNLGVLYHNGKGVPQDYKQAYVWFSIAAENGYSDAVKSRNLAAQKLPPHALQEAQADAAELFKALPQVAE